MKSTWKRLHPLFVFSFPLNQIFAVVSVLSSSRFVFLYFNQKKKEWYTSYFLVPTLHLISLKKKKKRFHLTSFAICHFLNFHFSKIFFVAAFVLSSSQLLLLHFSQKKTKNKKQKKTKKKKKTKTKTRRFQLFTLKVLFTLVSKGCRKSKNTTFKLAARRREVICLVSLFKIFFDLGV